MKFDWKRSAAVCITLAGGAVALYLICRYAIGLLMPFLVAFLLALITRPAVRYLAKKTKRSEKVIAALVTLFTLIVLGIIVYFLSSRLLIELQHFLRYLVEESNTPDGEVSQAIAFFRDLIDRIPFIEHLRKADFLKVFVDDPEAFIGEQLKNMLTAFTERVTGGVASALRALPALLFGLLVWVIASFYASIEFEGTCRALTMLLPPSLAERLPRWRARAGEIFRRYLKAYLLLFALTFGELLVGFLLLGVRYVFLLALITAILDALPVIGVGAVLIPFAILSFAGGSTFRGVGLLILYALMTVVRQIAEPHLVGKSLGLHPLLMLFSFYVGLKLFGVAGILVGPLLAVAVKGFFEGRKREEKSTC